MNRRIATRYDKLARNFLAAAALVGALLLDQVVSPDPRLRADRQLLLGI